MTRKYLVVLTILASSAVNQSSHAGLLIHPASLPDVLVDKQAHDLTTTQYSDAVRSAPNFPWRNLRKYKVLYVPGLFSDEIIQAGKTGALNWRVGEYFDDQIADLMAHKVSVERVAIESEESPEHNSLSILNAIERSDRPVILLTHSKGGLDTLELFLRRPETLEKVRGWIPIQSPFQGSPVADYLNNRANLKNLTSDLARILGGSIRALESLTMRERVPYIDANQEAISRIVSRIPVLSVATVDPGQFMRVNSPLGPLRDALQAIGIPSDGVVPRWSALLPGTDFVCLIGWDHMVTIGHSPFGDFDRVTFNRAILSLLLGRDSY